MSQIVDRGTLLTEFQAYIKRSFTADRQDTFVQLTEDRIYRDTRSQTNMINTSLVPTSQLVDLPSDFIDLRELSYQNGSRRIVLSSVGRHKLANFISQTGLPRVYSIIANQVEIAPRTLPDSLSLWYWRTLPNLTQPTDTNDMLTTFPYLWLYGMLIEGAVFIQDDQGRQTAIETYSTELQRVNNQADRSRFGEAPVLGAA